MPDMWEGDPSEAAFTLPGDEAKVAAMSEAAVEQSGETQERPRDAQGRFAPEQPIETAAEEASAPAETAASEEAGEQPAEPAPLLANKYGSVEELERAYVEAQARLAKRDEKAALADQYERALQQMQQQQQQAPPAQFDWEEMIDQNPAYATAYAAQVGDNYHYQQAFQAWDEASPGAPHMWIEMQQMKQQYGTLLEHQQRQVLGQKLADVEAKTGPLESHAEAISEIAGRYGILLDAFGRGTPEQQAEALELAAFVKRGLDADTLAGVAQDTARKLEKDEREAREEATVVTATRTNPEQPQTLAGRVAEEWWDDERRWNEGWNIG